MPNNENEESTPLLGTSNPGQCFDFNIFSITFYLKHNRIDKVVITLIFFYRIDILKPRLKIKHTSGCSKCWRRVCTSPGWTCSNLSRRSAPTILYNCDWRNASRDVQSLSGNGYERRNLTAFFKPLQLNHNQYQYQSEKI